MNETEQRAPFEKETTTGEWKPRSGSIYWYPLGPLYEMTVYPMLFGMARITLGRRDRDGWDVAWDYPDHMSACQAAENWDGKDDPPPGWIRKVGERGYSDDL